MDYYWENNIFALFLTLDNGDPQEELKKYMTDFQVLKVGYWKYCKELIKIENRWMNSRLGFFHWKKGD